MVMGDPKKVKPVKDLRRLPRAQQPHQLRPGPPAAVQQRGEAAEAEEDRALASARGRLGAAGAQEEELRLRILAGLRGIDAEQHFRSLGHRVAEAPLLALCHRLPLHRRLAALLLLPRLEADRRPEVGPEHKLRARLREAGCGVARLASLPSSLRLHVRLGPHCPFGRERRPQGRGSRRRRQGRAQRPPSAEPLPRLPQAPAPAVREEAELPLAGAGGTLSQVHGHVFGLGARLLGCRGGPGRQHHEVRPAVAQPAAVADAWRAGPEALSRRKGSAGSVGSSAFRARVHQRYCEDLQVLVLIAQGLAAGGGLGRQHVHSPRVPDRLGDDASVWHHASRPSDMQAWQALLGGREDELRQAGPAEAGGEEDGRQLRQLQLVRAAEAHDLLGRVEEVAPEHGGVRGVGGAPLNRQQERGLQTVLAAGQHLSIHEVRRGHRGREASSCVLTCGKILMP
mmetsp:Transcript_1666/g.5167  ORF Transcript_1666/g.5167 Transcript_1666/m.5167 type:complete len:454 (+) Transcript_1666:1361-2722(+)